jgi:hypothetical protein
MTPCGLGHWLEFPNPWIMMLPGKWNLVDRILNQRKSLTRAPVMASWLALIAKPNDLASCFWYLLAKLHLTELNSFPKKIYITTNQSDCWILSLQIMILVVTIWGVQIIIDHGSPRPASIAKKQTARYAFSCQSRKGVHKTWRGPWISWFYLWKVHLLSVDLNFKKSNWYFMK